MYAHRLTVLSDARPFGDGTIGKIILGLPEIISRKFHPTQVDRNRTALLRKTPRRSGLLVIACLTFSSDRGMRLRTAICVCPTKIRRA